MGSDGGGRCRTPARYLVHPGLAIPSTSGGRRGHASLLQVRSASGTGGLVTPTVTDVGPRPSLKVTRSGPTICRMADRACKGFELAENRNRDGMGLIRTSDDDRHEPNEGSVGVGRGGPSRSPSLWLQLGPFNPVGHELDVGVGVGQPT